MAASAGPHSDRVSPDDSMGCCGSAWSRLYQSLHCASFGESALACPADERRALKVERCLKLEIRRSVAVSKARSPASRELDDVLGLTERGTRLRASTTTAGGKA